MAHPIDCLRFARPARLSTSEYVFLNSGSKSKLDAIIGLSTSEYVFLSSGLEQPSRVTGQPSHVTSDPSHVTSYPSHVTSSPSHVTSSPSQVKFLATASSSFQLSDRDPRRIRDKTLMVLLGDLPPISLRCHSLYRTLSSRMHGRPEMTFLACPKNQHI